MVSGAVMILVFIGMSTASPTDVIHQADLADEYVVFNTIYDGFSDDDVFLDREKRGLFGGSGSGSGAGPSGTQNELHISETPQLQTKPEILEMMVTSKITARFASTEVRSVLKNLDEKAAEATFTLILPEDAFISAFSMTINDVVYDSQVKPKAVAQKEYNKAKARGQTAGQVKQSKPGDTKFKVSVTVAAETSVLFNLTYQQLLIRKGGMFENRISIQPGQVVPNVSVEVYITEPQGLKEVTSTWLISDKNDRAKLNSMTTLDIKPRTAHILFDSKEEGLLTTSRRGIMGDFIVTYDVIHTKKAGHLEIVDGYFVHYFSPDGLPNTRKNVIFVIDVSGSMYGQKTRQTKRAFTTILDDVRPIDRINIILFSSYAHVWREDQMVEATSDNIAAAKRHVNGLSVGGGTNIYDSLMKAVEILLEHDTGDAMPLIIMLTDGQVGNAAAIVRDVTSVIGGRLSLFSIGFGNGVDFPFLEKLSLSNQALARKVYEDSSASLQMKGFYDEVANPLLFNINMEYNNRLVDQNSLTKSRFISFFDGTEITVAGKLSDDVIKAVWESPKDAIENEGVQAEGENLNGYNLTSNGTVKSSRQRSETFSVGDDGNKSTDLELSVVITARSFDVDIQFNSSTTIEKERYVDGHGVSDFTERLWAYLTIKNLLDQRKTANNRETKVALSERALNLSLKYHFVTPLTSLLVVKPDVVDRDVQGGDTEADGEDDDADKGTQQPPPPSNPPNRRKTVPSPNIPAASSFSNAQSTSFADSDPHFMVEIPHSGLTVCFDINGDPGDVFNLLNDPNLNLSVSAYVIPVEKELPGAKKNRTYFGKIGVLLGLDRYLVLTSDTIEVNNEAFKLGWDDALSIRVGDFVVHIRNNHEVVIAHGDDVVLVIMVHRVKHRNTFLAEGDSTRRHQVDYLGFYIEEGKGFSEDVHGLVGQFQRKRKILVSSPQDELLSLEANDVKAELVIDDRKVPVHLMSRKIPLSREFHQCWHAGHNAKGLIEGDYTDYKLPHLNARPLLWDI
ncbi:inter-alpha-trypsin inhibitor heavy chain H3 [Strongylocentrotus purpuratus]|uniref:Inter-alpha-trypsin inhibitor heavy chain H3 n=1 Tax=Strongylocentrotus purpuratus TaxID=7668 RepID=A0A7M7REW3_STRPU|nr:inter-alpha-trypsin inhibitor heavy chain H3 [Strongylocentrotus purpuratus]